MSEEGIDTVRLFREAGLETTRRRNPSSDYAHGLSSVMEYAGKSTSQMSLRETSNDKDGRLEEALPKRAQPTPSSDSTAPADQVDEQKDAPISGAGGEQSMELLESQLNKRLQK